MATESIDPYDAEMAARIRAGNPDFDKEIIGYGRGGAFVSGWNYAMDRGGLQWRLVNIFQIRPLYTCETCGALVQETATAKHTDWHFNLRSI